MSDTTDLQIRRAMLRNEFDKLMYRKRRIDERLDHLAKQIEDATADIAIETMREEYSQPEPIKPVRLEMV